MMDRLSSRKYVAASRGQPCPHNGCGRPVKQNGLCAMHYQRLRRWGSADQVRVPGTLPTADQLLRRLEDKSIPEPNSGCVIWLGAVKAGGYGTMWDGSATQMVHRLSYRLHKGPIPEEMEVCHWCDIACCINPAHLWLGTQLDNIRDMVAKGRHARLGQKGESNARAVLTEDQVLEIRGTAKRMGAFVGLARKFNVRTAVVRDVWHRRTWRHV